MLITYMANNVKLMDTYYYCIGGSMILTFGSVDLFGGNPTRDGGLTQNPVHMWQEHGLREKKCQKLTH